jgi:hypothetical protein
MSAIMSSITLDRILFDSNIGRTITNGMSLMGSNTTIKNTLIQNSNTNSTPIGFFNLMMQSNL